MKTIFPLFALSMLLSAFAFAQSPVFIASKTSQTVQIQQDWSCNLAGTIEVGQFIGQSNDTNLYQIFLCFGDSIQISHHGDAELSGDPDPSSVPGIGYGFYACPPSVSGPSLPDVIGDPCILQGSPNGMFVTQSVPNGGDTWFFNDGSLQDIFSGGQPLSLFFAPITIDDFASNAYESAQIGTPPGPCVNVNVDEAFEVVYLNKITATGINNNFGNDCLGRFTIRNGYPQYDNNATYAIDISLTSDPAVKGLIMTTASNLFHLSSVSFTVCQPGLYTVSVEDGKSCGYIFQMDMSGCNTADNVALNIEEVAGKPGETVCVPLQVANFDIVSGSFSITWNPALLHFTEINQINPSIANLINLNTFVNTTVASTGNLGVQLYNALSLGSPLHVPDGESLFEVCFEVLDTTSSDCIAIGISNTLAGISMEDPLGQTLGVCTVKGGVCKSVATSELDDWEISKTFPNPVKAGETAYLELRTSESTIGQLLISNLQGAMVQAKEVEIAAGENHIALPTAELSPGIYFVAFVADDSPLIMYKVLVF